MANHVAPKSKLVILMLSLCVFYQQTVTNVTAFDTQDNSRTQSTSAVSKDSKPKFIVCYFPNWSSQRQGEAKFMAENIDPKICTHINYAFAKLDSETLTMIPSIPHVDIEQNYYERILNLKQQNKKLKVVISLGGWADSAGDKYSRMVSFPEIRSNFVNESVTFLNKYKFDGLDLDWEFPVCWQTDCSKGNPDDKKNFVHLVQELRDAFDKQSPPLLLTIAVSAAKYIAEKAYDIADLAKYVDFFNVMNYNLHGGWEKTTGHNSELHGHSHSEVGTHSSVTGLEYFVRHGSPPEKLMMGIPLFGRTYTLANPNSNGIGAPATGNGREGLYTKEAGFLAYYEICDMIKNNDWTVRRDPAAGPYAFHGDQWVGYDDPQSAEEKALLILEKGYGGAMVFDLSFDDFKGKCHKSTFPVIRALKMKLRPHDDSEASGSSALTDKRKEIILWIAAFMILKGHLNAYVMMYIF